MQNLKLMHVKVSERFGEFMRPIHIHWNSPIYSQELAFSVGCTGISCIGSACGAGNLVNRGWVYTMCVVCGGGYCQEFTDNHFSNPCI